MSSDENQRRGWKEWVINLFLRGVIGVALALPHRLGVGFIGWLTRAVIGPLSGYSARARDNLRYVWPEKDADEIARIARAVLDNSGRTLIENYAASELLRRAPDWPFRGEGLPEAEAALAAGRPILFVSGHFGNYQAARAAMNVRGFELGALYRPFNNGYFNEHYHDVVEAVGGTAFPRGYRGLSKFLRSIKEGGQGALLIDQYYGDGPLVDFMGKPAPTTLSVGEMALKYDALVLPIYARRQKNGLDFDVLLEAPIPHSDPLTMTRALVASLEAQVEADPGQWFWIHRRWKPERQAAREARGL